ncbi:MAG: CARDB domain-containing protein [Chloroflexota bacterium]
MSDTTPDGTTLLNQATLDGDGFTPELATAKTAVGLFPTYLPIIVQSPAPDLVGSFYLTPNKPTFVTGEPVQITVVITNQGSAAAGPFWLDLFISPTAPPIAANTLWNHTCGLTPCYGLAWGVANGLAPGQTLTLTSTPDSYSTLDTVWPGSFAAGTSDLHLYVDSWNPGIATGAVIESNEYNNSAALYGLEVGGFDKGSLVDSEGVDMPERPVLPK